MPLRDLTRHARRRAGPGTVGGMNNAVASFRLSEIILHALDCGFTGIQVERAPGLFGEHVIRLGLPDLPGVTGVVTISALGLAGDDGRRTVDAIKAEMKHDLLPTMRLVAQFEAYWRQMEKAVADMFVPSADSDWWAIGPMPLSAPAPKALPIAPIEHDAFKSLRTWREPAPKALPSPATFDRLMWEITAPRAAKAPPVQPWPVVTAAELAALEHAAFPLRTYQVSDTPPKPKASPVETVKVKVDVDVDNLDELRELKRELQSITWEYERAADAAERFNEARAEVDEDTRADMAFLTSTLAEGTDHQRTTYETLREAGVPVHEIATSFRSAFDTQADG